jgi:hypothetical protein
MSSRLGRRLARKKPGLIFIHVPKTGGSSILHALGKRYPFSQYHIKAAASLFAAKIYYGKPSDPEIFSEQVQKIRIPLVHYYIGQETKYLCGHVWYDETFERHRAGGYRLMTCLREPVSRFYSHYLWNRYKLSSHDRTELDFEHYLQTAETRPLGALYVRYIGGIREDGDYESEQAIERAASNLSRFDIIGHLEDLEGLCAQVRERLGFRIKLGHSKSSPAPHHEIKRIKGSRELRAAVEMLCRPDLEFYHRVAGAKGGSSSSID